MHKYLVKTSQGNFIYQGDDTLGELSKKLNSFRTSDVRFIKMGDVVVSVNDIVIIEVIR